eukprot:15469213-Alexandrium_andersonii.AAC.1
MQETAEHLTRWWRPSVAYPQAQPQSSPASTQVSRCLAMSRRSDRRSSPPGDNELLEPAVGGCSNSRSS